MWIHGGGRLSHAPAYFADRAHSSVAAERGREEKEFISAISINLLREWAFLLRAKSSRRRLAVIASLTVFGRLVGGSWPFLVCQSWALLHTP